MLAALPALDGRVAADGLEEDGQAARSNVLAKDGRRTSTARVSKHESARGAYESWRASASPHNADAPVSMQNIVMNAMNDAPAYTVSIERSVGRVPGSGCGRAMS